MRTKLIAVVLASAVAGCATPGQQLPSRGVESVHQPVLNRSTFTVDLSAPGGVLAPSELARLDSWFQSLDLGYGDSIYLDGAYAETTRAQLAEVAGRYGMMVLPAAPVTAGMVPAGSVRVVVSRNRAEVPGCPDWTVPASPNYENRMMSNFGCSVNSNLAMQVANPEDLFHGRAGPATVDAIAGAKAVEMYRNWPLTGVKQGQSERPFKPLDSTTEGK